MHFSDAKIAIFKYLSFKQRHELVARNPNAKLLRIYNEKLPFNFQSLEITHQIFKIDGQFNWCEFETGSNEKKMGELVQFYLNRVGTRVRELRIENAPKNFESLPPLRVTNFLSWNITIHSHRFDHTTIFECLRINAGKTKKVEIFLEGPDNSILQEPMIQEARELSVKTRTLLPIRAILNFSAEKLTILGRSVSSDEQREIETEWQGNRKKLGETLEIEDAACCSTLKWEMTENGVSFKKNRNIFT